MQLQLFNTMGRTIEPFVPFENNRVKLYACGPTVYNFAHIGNLRTYVFVDILRRSLGYLGYAVDHVMNVTDVGHLSDDADEGEDKVISAARQKRMTPWEVSEFYTKAFFEDTDRLRILKPTVVCKATDHIDDMIALIKRIEANGYIYEAGGNIYFDITKFPDYGKLALLSLEDLKAGSRIEIDREKKNPHDFVLWFTRSKFERQAMLWDSPWGRGYPGWHIECSAMSMRYLGEHFDIHCGGIDHIPVHHTNEIAQSEAATGKKWVNLWLHGEFLVLETEKMSKSKGNFITLRTLTEKGFDPLDYRYFCLGAHYRTQLKFSFQALSGARNARVNLFEKVYALKEETGGETPEKIGPQAERHLASFNEHLASDINMPQALSDLWNLLSDGTLTAGEKLSVLFTMDRVFGLGLADARRPAVHLTPEEEELIAKRREARDNKNFLRADEIRKLLQEKGITVEDTPDGVRVKKT